MKEYDVPSVAVYDLGAVVEVMRVMYVVGVGVGSG